MTQIRFENVIKRFGMKGGRTVAALQDLDVVVGDQEFFTFVGPSGCGKSTALNLIAGLERASDGRLYFDDEEVGHLDPKDRDVAMVFQSYALYPHMTVYENVAFPLRIRKRKKPDVEKAVEEVARAVGIQDLLDRSPKALSGGQRQRVALARALVRRPRVFLMDEPLSNLDAKLRLEMRGELKRIHEKWRITTVYVTHDQEEAMVLSDRVAVMRGGRVQQCAPPMEVYLHPANRFVAEFVGSPPINIVDGARLAKLSGFQPLFAGLDADQIDCGVRPSDLTPGDAGPKLPATVMFFEVTGRERWVNVEWEGGTLKAMGPGDPAPSPGEEIELSTDLSRILLFDKASGARIERK